MKEFYDHSKLQAGDIACYSDGAGWGGWNQHIKRTKVARLTTTQIVMADGTRFRRDTGRRVGSTGNGWLLDPKGEVMLNAMGALEASSFGYAVTQWDKVRRNIKTLDSWEICLSQLEKEISEAKRRILDIKKEMEQ